MGAAGNFMGALMGQLQPQIDQREADKQASKKVLRDTLLKGMQTDPPQNEGESDTAYASRKAQYHQQLLDEYNKTLHHPGAKELLQKAGQALGLYHKIGAPGTMPTAAPSTPSTTGAPVSGLPSPVAAQPSAGGAAALPPIPGLNVNAGGFETGAGSPAMPSTPRPVNPVAAPDLPSGKDLNASEPGGITGRSDYGTSPDGSVISIPRTTNRAAQPIKPIPAPVMTAQAAPKFDYGTQGVINNQAPAVNTITNNRILQAERKKQAEQIGLKPGTRDYSQYVLLGQLPAVRANTALQRHELRVENWKTKIDPDTGDYYTDDKANQKAAEQELAVKSSDIQVHMNDGSVVPGIEDINGNKTRLDGTPFTKDELKNATGVFRNSSAAPRISPSEILTVDAAQSELEQGHQLNIIDPQGKPMTLAEVKGMKKQDPNLVLQYVHANNQTYLTPRSNRASEIVFNGKQYIVNPIEMQKGVREGSEIMGQGTPPTGEQTGVVTGGVPNALAGTNAQNMPATQSVVNGQIVTNPATRKSSRSGFAQFGGANAQSIGEAAPLQAPAAPRNGASSQKPASTSSVGNDPARIYATGQTAPVPISQMSNAIKVATPIREYTTQIYGQRGLSNFSDLFKDGDKASIDRVGKVMRLVMKPLVDKDKGDSISAGGGGFHLSLGGLGNILAVKLGIPQKDAETQQQMIADQYRSLSQRERDYVDMVMSSLSTIQGARGAIGGNATDRTVAAIEKDVPIWGYNTWDRHEFNNKLLSLEKVAREAQVNRPVGLFNFQEIQDWHQKHFNPDGSDKVISGGSQPSSKNKLNAPAPGGVLSPAGREYLQNLNK